MNKASRMNRVKKSAIREIFDSAPENSINLGLGEIQFPQDDFITNSAIEILKNDKPGYTPNAGLRELRKAIANYYNFDKPDNICVTLGAQEGLYAIFNTFFEAGDEVLLSDPAFVAYETVLRISGAEPLFFDLDRTKNFAVDFNSLERKINKKTKAIVLNNPSNPLSVSFSETEINRFLEIAQNHNLLIIVDEIYRELFSKTRNASFLKKYKNCIIISGLSKSHKFTGWRLGWVISQNHDLIQPVINTHQYIATCAPYLSQKLAVKALSKKGMKCTELLRKQLSDNLYSAKKILDKNSIKYFDTDSFPYLMVQTPFDDFEFCTKLVKKGIITIPGSAFGNNTKNMLRLSCAMKKNKLKTALKEFATIFKKLQN